MRPAGRHVLKLCRAEACKAAGGDALAARAEAKLGISLGNRIVIAAPPQPVHFHFAHRRSHQKILGPADAQGAHLDTDGDGLDPDVRDALETLK